MGSWGTLFCVYISEVTWMAAWPFILVGICMQFHFRQDLILGYQQWQEMSLMDCRHVYCFLFLSVKCHVCEKNTQKTPCI